MKRVSLILLIVMTFAVLSGQDNNSEVRLTTGFYTSAGWNMPVRLTSKYITEETSPWYGYQTWSAGVYLTWKPSKLYSIETSIGYSWHKIGFELSPPIYEEKTIYTETFALIKIAFALERNLDQNFYIHAGTFVDFPFNGKPQWLDPQSGFGFSLGAGKEIWFRNFVFDISPVTELHSLIPFTTEAKQQRLFTVSLRLGVEYKWKSRGKTENKESVVKENSNMKN